MSAFWSFDEQVFYSYDQRDTIPLTDQTMHSLILTIIDSAGCQAVHAQPVRSADVQADFWLSNQPPICGPSQANFMDFSNTSHPSGITSWEWNFGEPSSGTANNATIAEPTHTYTTSGLFDIQLIVSDSTGCKDTLLKQNFIFVSIPEININVDTSTCAGGALPFQNLATDDSVTYSWDFGNGQTSTQKSPSATFAPPTEPAQFVVNMTATDSLGCTSTYQQTIHIEAFEPDFSATPTSADCPPLNVQFTMTGTGNIGSALWDFGNGSSGSLMHPLYTYQEPGTYSVTLTAYHEDGCPKTKTVPNLIQVLGPYGAMQASRPSVCPGDTISVEIVTHDADSASVVFGDGEIATAGQLNFSQDTLRFTHVYHSPGPKTVVAIGVSALCSRAMTSYPIVVETPPTAAIAPVDTILCLSTLRQVASAAVPGSTPLNAWNWGWLNQTSSGQSANIGSGTLGGFLLTHTVTDTAGCKDTAYQYFRVIPYPVVAASLADSTLCAGEQALAVAQFSPDSATLSWTLNKQPLTSKNDSIFFDAKITEMVYIIASDHSCATTAQVLLQVFPVPSPAFNTEVTGCDSPVVTFMPADSQVLAARWFINDSVLFTNELRPIRQFVPGIYPIRYTAWAQNGCSSDTSAQLVLPEPPQAEFLLQPCADMSPYDHISFCIAPQITVPIKESYTLRWDFGDGTLAIIPNMEHDYELEGIYNVRLVVTDPATGCTAVAIHPHEVEYPDLMIPNFFSPNGDGPNDTWYVTYTGLRPVSSRIYDRWGRLMASLPTLDSAWDGRAINGEPAPVGVYFWVVQIGEREYKGNVTLSR